MFIMKDYSSSVIQPKNDSFFRLLGKRKSLVGKRSPHQAFKLYFSAFSIRSLVRFLSRSRMGFKYWPV